MARFQQAVRVLKMVALVGASALTLTAICKHTVLKYSSQVLIVPRVVSIRSAVNGFVSYSSPVTEGAHLPPSFGMVDDPGRDDRTLNELGTELSIARSEKQMTIDRAGTFTEKMNEERDIFVKYRGERTRQLDFAVSEAESDLEVARARAVEAEKNYERKRALRETQTATDAEVEEAERAATVARRQVEGTTAQLDATKAARRAAQTGHDVGVADQTSSSVVARVRSQDLELLATEAERLTRMSEAKTSGLVERLAAEHRRLTADSRQELVAPKLNRVARVAATEGQYVPRGTTIVELFDCEQYTVVAYVREWVFEQLAGGDRAQLRVSNSSQEFEGTVTGLLGPLREADGVLPPLNPAQAGNFDTYRVLLTFPELPHKAGERCDGVLLGEVYFPFGFWPFR